jgi:hypothetical protein
MSTSYDEFYMLMLHALQVCAIVIRGQVTTRQIAAVALRLEEFSATCPFQPSVTRLLQSTCSQISFKVVDAALAPATSRPPTLRRDWNQELFRLLQQLFEVYKFVVLPRTSSEKMYDLTVHCEVIRTSHPSLHCVSRLVETACMDAFSTACDFTGPTETTLYTEQLPRLTHIICSSEIHDEFVVNFWRARKLHPIACATSCCCFPNIYTVI